MEFLSERFGLVSYDEQSVLSFSQGLVGFPGMTRWFMLRDERLEPMVWLHSLDDPNLAFLLCDPFLFFTDYELRLRLPASMLRSLGEQQDLHVMAIVTPNSVFSRSTVNLLGPLVINMRTHQAWQVILDDEQLGTRHPLFPERPAGLRPQALAV